MPDKGLSLPEFTALLVLAVEAREVSATELKEQHKLIIDRNKRERLNDLKLIESWQPRRGRAYIHVLTDSGWARLAADINSGAIPPMTGSPGAIARSLLVALRRFMQMTDHRLAEIFHPEPAEADSDALAPDASAADPAFAASPAEPDPGGSPGDLESRIRAAYAELTTVRGSWVSLTPLRRMLADVPRATLDETLIRMERLPDVNIVPESNQKTLTPEDREAAVIIGDRDKHLLWIGKP